MTSQDNLNQPLYQFPQRNMYKPIRDWIWRGWQVRYTFLRPPSQSTDSIPLVLIHGFGASHNQWKNNLPILGQHYPIYALDLVGFGASQKAATTYQVDLWAQQVHDFCQILIGRPVVLIGHSLGALVVATAAKKYPHAIAGVAMMTLPATRQERISNPLLQRVLGAIETGVANPLVIRFIFNIARQRRIIRSALKLAYENENYVTEELVDDFIVPTQDRGSAQTLCRLTQGATTTTYSQSRETLLSGISQPMLVIWGTGDRIIPISQSQSLKIHFPSITWEEIPEAGHCLYDECAETVNGLLLNWIEQHIKLGNLKT